MRISAQKFSDGVSIFHEGDPGKEFYLMIQGTAKVVTFDTNLKHLVEAGRLVAGDYFGETALLRNEKRSATVIATSAVTCMMLRKDQFLDLVKSLPLPFAARRPNLTVTLPARIGDAGGELKRPAKPTHAMTSETRYVANRTRNYTLCSGCTSQIRICINVIVPMHRKIESN